ncbi:MAG: hypothetical protein IPL65_15500 [Lewinellaceae bacterium]|nr:hypothetical protein [Lewinellaceae bacterium]
MKGHYFLPKVGCGTTGVLDSRRRLLTRLTHFVMLVMLTGFASTLNAQITGTVFRDFNGDGVQQAGEPGRGGIIVKAYTNATLPAKDVFLVQTTTNANGQYTLSPPSYPVRLEFSIPTGLCNLDPDQDFPAPNGATYGTATQFALAPGVYNFIINYPADFSIDPDPFVFTPCFVNGNPLGGGDAGTADAFVRFNYLDNGHGANSGYGNPGPNGGPYGPPHDIVAAASQVGTVWGVAYSRQAKRIFTDAFMKRHAGMGPLGPGGIYMVDVNNFSTAANYNWLDFDSELGIATHDAGGVFDPTPMDGSNNVHFVPTVGSNVARGLSADKNDPSRDAAAWEQVGKVSFGDIDISEDGRYLFVVNLYDRKLYMIDLQDPYNPVKPTMADVGTKVKGFQIPNPCGGNPMAGEYRPFALKFARGKLYVVVICSAQHQNGDIVGTQNDMTATVYKFDLATETWDPTPELQFPLNYRDNTANRWVPWTSQWINCFQCEGFPMLADIEFDSDGNMILGIMDRRGHQAGWYNMDLNGSLNENIAAVGDILRAVRDPNQANCTYSISFNPEFYKDDKYHPEPTQGGLAVHRTSDYDNILAAYMDPVWIWSGGVMRFDNKTGNQIGNGYEIYYTGNTAAGAFGKAHGIGDLEVIEQEPPIELGNRIWADTDHDGIQDGDEVGIPNVTVQLKWPDGTILATTTTNADGEYYFFINNVADGDPVTPGAQVGPQPYTMYKICVPASQFGTGQPLKNHLLTIPNQAGVGALDESDSDGEAQPNGDIQIMVQTGERGQNIHSLDFGFLVPEYGDLPDSYGTTVAANGPWHTMSSQLKLGSCVDSENNGIPGAMANGDDNLPGGANPIPTIPQASYPCDDEDGVVFATPMIPGYQACVTVTVMNSTGADAVLQGWIDFNGDGQFQANEQLTTLDFAPSGKVVPNGGLNNAKLCFTVPANATFQGGMAMSRFRISTTGGLTPNGPGGIGEVEDYKQPLAKVGTLVWNDYNNDGIQNEAASAGINGVTVNLTWLGPNGTLGGGDDVVYSTTTANMGGTDGIYMFFGLTPGMYKIAPAAPAGYIDGREDLGGNDAKDGDAHAGVMVNINNPINLTTGENGTGDNPGGTNGFPDNQDDLRFDFNYVAVDYGDLPDTYGTTENANGPKHIVNPNLKLGAASDGDPDGQPDSMAGAMTGGDDNDADGDDEDGIAVSGPMIPGQQACIIVNAMNMTGAAAKLQGWIDWNGDGQFQPTEQISTGDFAPSGASVPNGGLTNAKLCFTVPAAATFQGGKAMMRSASVRQEAFWPLASVRRVLYLTVRWKIIRFHWQR